jgi:ABC-2 type transport system permease protein
MNRVIAIARKDLAQIFRNRFIAVISLLVIVLFALIYLLLPSEVDEVFKMGFHLEAAEEADSGVVSLDRELIEQRLSEAGGQETAQGLELIWTDTVQDLMGMVEEGEVSAGFSLDLSGQEPAAVLFVSSKTPQEVVEAGEAIAGEIAYALIGYQLPADFDTTVIGRDMAGQRIPMRDRLRVLLLAFVFLLELYGLGNLLVEEIQRKTAEAILVTPVSLREFVAAKAIVGVIMAFLQGLIMALLLGAMSGGTWLAVLVFLLFGAAMTVGIAFIVGSTSKDFISMIMVSMIPFVLLMLPGFALLYPGFSSPVIKAIPTYWLVVPLDGILNYGMGLSDYLSSLLYLALFAAGFFLLGFAFLKRRLA